MGKDVIERVFEQEIRVVMMPYDDSILKGMVCYFKAEELGSALRNDFIKEEST